MNIAPKTLRRRGPSTSLSNHPDITMMGKLSLLFVRQPQRQQLQPSRCCRLFSDGKQQQRRPDPMARRPTAKCDPFGQGGKPLVLEDAMRLVGTVDPAWSVLTEWKVATTKDDQESSSSLEHPFAIIREFQHPDFISAASFLKEVAAVAQMNDHFPSLTMERKLNSRKKMWTIVSSVECHTKVLGGLSHHDFFLATLIDVEIERPELKSLLVFETNDMEDKQQ